MEKYFWGLLVLISLSVYFIDRRLDAIIEILQQIRDKGDDDNNDSDDNNWSPDEPSDE